MLWTSYNNSQCKPLKVTRSYACQKILNFKVNPKLQLFKIKFALILQVC